MWTTVRYILSTEFLADESELFYFEEMLMDPVDWFRRYLPFIGLHVPAEVIFDLADEAANEGGMFGLTDAGVDVHPGGAAPAPSRTYKDELGPESLAMMDDVLRAWLPSVLLNRWGVEMP